MTSAPACVGCAPSSASSSTSWPATAAGDACGSCSTRHRRRTASPRAGRGSCSRKGPRRPPRPPARRGGRPRGGPPARAARPAPGVLQRRPLGGAWSAALGVGSVGGAAAGGGARRPGRWLGAAARSRPPARSWRSRREPHAGAALGAGTTAPVRLRLLADGPAAPIAVGRGLRVRRGRAARCRSPSSSRPGRDRRAGAPRRLIATTDGRPRPSWAAGAGASTRVASGQGPAERGARPARHRHSRASPGAAAARRGNRGAGAAAQWCLAVAAGPPGCRRTGGEREWAEPAARLQLAQRREHTGPVVGGCRTPGGLEVGEDAEVAQRLVPASARARGVDARLVHRDVGLRGEVGGRGLRALEEAHWGPPTTVT